MALDIRAAMRAMTASSSHPRTILVHIVNQCPIFIIQSSCRPIDVAQAQRSPS